MILYSLEKLFSRLEIHEDVIVTKPKMLVRVLSLGQAKPQRFQYHDLNEIEVKQFRLTKNKLIFSLGISRHKFSFTSDQSDFYQSLKNFLERKLIQSHNHVVVSIDEPRSEKIEAPIKDSPNTIAA